MLCQKGHRVCYAKKVIEYVMPKGHICHKGHRVCNAKKLQYVMPKGPHSLSCQKGHIVCHAIRVQYSIITKGSIYDHIICHGESVL